MLPGPSGYDICRKLREKSDCPIVFLTALGTEDNILLGYEMGADEYITKPFSLMILYTKCLILLDRKVKRQQERVLESGDIKLNPSRMQVIAGGKEVELAYKEYFLLKALLENKGHVLSRQKLLDLVWGTDYFGNDRVVDTHIKNIRHKLGASGNQIRTVIGCGYKAV
jgi:DNA-binding response OmpR family regulator